MVSLQGLTEAQAQKLRAAHGPNEIAEKRVGGLSKLLRSVRSPASLMLVAAAALSFIIDRTFDGWFILALLVLNVGMSWWHERKADRALEELRAKLSVSVRVLRDGAWRAVPSRELVVGDIVECGVGNLVPADVSIAEAVNLELNEAVLTGESLPKEKHAGEPAYSGAVVSTGLLRGTVTAIGNDTFFGKIAVAGGTGKRRSAMEKDILAVSRFLIIASLTAVAALTAFLLYEQQGAADTLLLDLSLLIAGIPVSLPTVMTLIVSLGAVEVARKQALVRRLTALEDFANTTLLLTDKTGTLTENRISVERFSAYAPWNEEALLRLAGAASAGDSNGAIEQAIAKKAQERLGALAASVEDSVPGDSVRKRQTVLLSSDGKRYLLSLGTPPVVAGLCDLAEDARARFDADVSSAAHDGSRAIAIAIKEAPSDIKDETHMQLAGVFVLADPLRADAPETLAFLRKEGVSAIMLTGDTKETAARVCEILGLSGTVLRASETDIKAISPESLTGVAAFAEVLPDDKLTIVEAAQKKFTVAVTGDGVNDLPAVRRADVGMAVANAVDALKGTADIVFLAGGISAIQTALIEARKIFFRLYNYSVYRISESFRLIVTVFVLGILVRGFPLTPVELILLAFLNDVPIITLAFDRIKRTDRPADLKPRERFTLGTLYGSVGILNSLTLYFLMTQVWHAPLPVVQTAFFLKLTVSGHMLIYVAHTRDRWWRFLPARSVIAATTLTQLFATGLTLTGTFVAPITIPVAVFVWVWSLFWMQIAEGVKVLNARLQGAEKPAPAPEAAAV